MEDSLTAIHDLAVRLADEAAALLLGALHAPRATVETKSSATDMVTEMDAASERLIVTGIRAARPDDAILSEEGGGIEGASGYRWVVDPIDGTTNYLYRHPGFAISIAVEHAGETVVGVVNDPLHGDAFTAICGAGAKRNGEAIEPSATADPARALLATGFGYDPAMRERQGAAVARLLPRIRDIRRMGAAAVDLCSVACGRVDAYFERGLNPWDLAAGELIAAEAGVRLGAIGGGPLEPGSVLAAPPALFEPLQRLLAECGAADDELRPTRPRRPSRRDS